AQEIMNTLSDGVALAGAGGTLTSANRSFRALLGVPAAGDISHENIFALLSRFAGCDSSELLRGTSSRPKRADLQRSNNIADGVYRVCGVPLQTAAGESDAVVWTIRDVTQQKLADQMRTQFVETATHELRTPLANIRAYAETLQLADDIPIEQQKEFINIINAEATRLGRFVDELLNLSRMDAGSITISRHETDFERLLNECIEHSRPQMNQKNQTFETQIPAKLPMLRVDKDKIAACLINLLGNASKYTPAGGEIRLIVEESSRELSLSVKDTGFGISETDLPNVFARFYRSDDERVREESGSGLGLAYTSEIVRLHGGRLTVDSKLNEGSQFAMHLPL
ncbi:MAG: hypothetical protein KDA89_02205, partial [Planctomycetaceae bacterium]|nr:hypothetical protein [Planctomycetaceae bacterium]